jgi:hypothetical protein
MKQVRHSRVPLHALVHVIIIYMYETSTRIPRHFSMWTDETYVYDHANHTEQMRHMYTTMRITQNRWDICIRPCESHRHTCHRLHHRRRFERATGVWTEFRHRYHLYICICMYACVCMHVIHVNGPCLYLYAHMYVYVSLYVHMTDLEVSHYPHVNYVVFTHVCVCVHRCV